METERGAHSSEKQRQQLQTAGNKARRDSTSAIYRYHQEISREASGPFDFSDSRSTVGSVRIDFADESQENGTIARRFLVIARILLSQCTIFCRLLQVLYVHRADIHLKSTRGEFGKPHGSHRDKNEYGHRTGHSTTVRTHSTSPQRQQHHPACTPQSILVSQSANRSK